MVTIPRQGKRSARFIQSLCTEVPKADAENVALAKGATEKRQKELNVGSCLLRNNLQWSLLIDQCGQSLWPQAQWVKRSDRPCEAARRA